MGTQSKGGNNMNEVWKTIFKSWVKDYDSIDYLDNNLIEEEQTQELRTKLLIEIIETIRTEVED